MVNINSGLNVPLKIIKLPYFAKHKTKTPSFLLTNILKANNLLMFKIEDMAASFCEAAASIYLEINDLTRARISFEFTFNRGEFSMLLYRRYTIVDDVQNPEAEISKEQSKSCKSLEIIGNEWIKYIKFKTEFDRNNINRIKDLFMHNCIDKRNKFVYDQMQDQKNKIIIGNIELINNQFIKLKYKNVYGFLPRKNQIPNEQLDEGQNIEVYVSDVVKDPYYSFPLVFSRVAKGFLNQILIDEVPEIAAGIITVECIEWIPSVKAKVGVASSKDVIDPIGSCIGQRGDRINNVSQRINNEKIDIFLWSNDQEQLLVNLFHPIKILEVKTNDQLDHYTVYIDKDDMNCAIGKFGSNIKLISRVMNALVTVTYDEDENEEEDNQQ